MPPSRPRAAVDESSRSETSSIFPTKERQTALKTATAGSSKVKRAANVTNATSIAQSGSKATLTTTGGSAKAPKLDPEASHVAFPAFPLSFLHTYRHTYSLSTPSAYANPHAHNILSNGVGNRSPSSIAAKRATRASSKVGNGSTTATTRSSGNGGLGSVASSNTTGGRITKDRLMANVRKHFNNFAISEADTCVAFRYVVQMGGLMESGAKGFGSGLTAGPGPEEREFRLRFHPRHIVPWKKV